MSETKTADGNIFRNFERFTLNANQLKIIALVVMTIDHIGAYMYKIPVVYANYDSLRFIGRIAAPLFLFLLAESVRHTRNRPRLILRLYIANLAVVAAHTISNTFFLSYLGINPTGNIFQTFLATALAICMIDMFIKAIKEKDLKALLHGGIYALLLILPIPIYYFMNDFIYSMPGFATAQADSMFTVVMAVFPCVLIVEYSPLFVLLGVVWYYTRNRILQLLSFTGLSLYSASNMLAGVQFISVFSGKYQHWMILAAPLILLYNEKKGGSMKYFFYIYYILHPYVLVLLVKFLT